MLGHGGIVVFDDTVDLARQARFAFEFCAIEMLRQVHALPDRLDPRCGDHRPGSSPGEDVAENLELVRRPLRAA